MDGWADVATSRRNPGTIPADSRDFSPASGVTLDLSDPGRPREVSRLTLAPGDVPHWIAVEPNGDRVVIGGYEALESRILVAQLDRRSGALRLDPAFTTPAAARPGVDFARELWPHGATGRAIPHGVVFARPPR